MRIGHVVYLTEKDLAKSRKNKEKVDGDCFRCDISHMLYEVDLAFYTSPKGKITVIKDRDGLVK